jgi:mRNA interferase MazF
MVGRIYLAKIYFTDLSEYKIRPVLVLRVYGEDCLCLPLTSNLKHEGFLLETNDLVDGFLKKQSKVIFPKIFTLHRSILIKHIATARQDILSTIHLEFCKKLECTAKT